jgi:hypothetical protein
LGQLQVVARHTDTSPSSCYEPVLIPGPLRWHVNKCLCNKRKGGMDQGSVNAPPPLEHRQSGVGWSKLQATSFRPQALSLTAGPGYDRMNLERNNYGQ